MIKAKTLKAKEAQYISLGLEIEKLTKEVRKFEDSGNQGYEMLRKSTLNTLKKRYNELQEEINEARFDKFLEDNREKAEELTIEDKMSDYICSHTIENIDESKLDEVEARIANNITQKEVELKARDLFDNKQA